eukprot:748788-Hanusia_phi.AAC.1
MLLGLHLRYVEEAQSVEILSPAGDLAMASNGGLSWLLGVKKKSKQDQPAAPLSPLELAAVTSGTGAGSDADARFPEKGDREGRETFAAGWVLCDVTSPIQGAANRTQGFPASDLEADSRT